LLALEHYRAAVDLLSSKLKGKQPMRSIEAQGSEEMETRSTIVRALIGQVEIWMDPTHDLWCASSFTSVIPHTPVSIKTGKELKNAYKKVSILLQSRRVKRCLIMRSSWIQITVKLCKPWQVSGCRSSGRTMRVRCSKRLGIHGRILKLVRIAFVILNK
jgi:hypothetical protein